MLDPSAVGYTGPSFDFPLEAGKVHELARAVDSTQPAYLGAQPIAAPILLKVAQFCWEPEGGSAVERVGFDRKTPPLHARQEFEFRLAPPRTGTTLRAQTTVAEIQTRPSKRFGTAIKVALVTDFRDETGRLIAGARSISVQPLSAGHANRQHSAATRGDARGDAPGDARVPASRPVADAATRTFGPITQTQVVRYQGASGDFNPVHHDPIAARSAGWPAVLVPGLLSAAVLSDLATGWLGAAKLRRFCVDFLQPVWLGDQLHCTASTARRVGPGEARIQVDLSCVRASDSVPVTTGTAVFIA